MKRPRTRSCIVVVLEKHMVRRTSRLIRARKWRYWLSISLRVLLAHVRLHWVDMPRISAPSIGGKAGHTTRFQQGLECEKDRSLPSPKAVGQHGPTVRIDRMPHPPRLRFLAHGAPPRIEF